jgi:DNA-binding transcriptional MerR regulator
MLSAREVSRLAGFKKPWMLNHLEREEIFVPEIGRARHHGRHRNYTFRDLVILRAINRMLELGARPKRVKVAIETFRRACPDVIGDVSMEGIQLKFANESGHFVITQNEVLYCRGEDIISLLQRGQLAFSFMVDAAASTLPCLRAASEVIALSQTERRKSASVEKIAVKHAI